jgi:hypothetical protein
MLLAGTFYVTGRHFNLLKFDDAIVLFRPQVKIRALRSQQCTGVVKVVERAFVVPIVNVAIFDESEDRESFIDPLYDWRRHGGVIVKCCGSAGHDQAASLG